MKRIKFLNVFRRKMRESDEERLWDRLSLFLKWSFIASLTLAATVIAISLGWFEKMYRMDVTKLTVVILCIFVWASACCGVLTWKLSKFLERTDSSADETEAIFHGTETEAENGWFAMGLCEKLGLTGTVFGFVIMLMDGFSGFQASDQQAIQDLLDRLSGGMSTAFVTTLVGIVCSVLLSLQYQLLAQSIRRRRT